MAKDTLRGNCFRLKGTVLSEGTNGIRGMNTVFPVSCPVMMTASMTLLCIFWTTNLVPLQRPGGSAQNYNLNDLLGKNWKSYKLTQVADAHDWTANLEVETVSWQSRRPLAVEKLNRECGCRFCVQSSVEGKVDTTLTRHLVQEGCVEGVHSRVFGGKNCSVPHPLEVRYVVAEVGIHLALEGAKFGTHSPKSGGMLISPSSDR